jgi:phosphomannomutase
VHATDQLSVRVRDLSLIHDAMSRLRAEPPASLVGQPVSVVDLSTGSAELPPTDGMRITGDTVTVVVRPSGTEPKLKCYLEARVPPEQRQDLPAARAGARRVLDQIRVEIAQLLGMPNA